MMCRFLAGGIERHLLSAPPPHRALLLTQMVCCSFRQPFHLLPRCLWSLYSGVSQLFFFSLLAPRMLFRHFPPWLPMLPFPPWNFNTIDNTMYLYTYCGPLRRHQPLWYLRLTSPHRTNFCPLQEVIFTPLGLRAPPLRIPCIEHGQRLSSHSTLDPDVCGVGCSWVGAHMVGRVKSHENQEELLLLSKCLRALYH